MILAIDPGPDKSAYVQWDGARVRDAQWVENCVLRSILSKTLAERECEVAIEMIASYGMAVGADVFRTCVEIGRLVEVADRNGVEPMLVFRKDVKLHLCGTPRAKDANIRQALIDKHGIVGTKKNPGPLFGIKSHMWAALAVADTAWPIAEKQHAEHQFDPVRDGWVGADGRP